MPWTYGAACPTTLKFELVCYAICFEDRLAFAVSFHILHSILCLFYAALHRVGLNCLSFVVFLAALHAVPGYWTTEKSCYNRVQCIHFSDQPRLHAVGHMPSKASIQVSVVLKRNPECFHLLSAVLSSEALAVWRRSQHLRHWRTKPGLPQIRNPG